MECSPGFNANFRQKITRVHMNDPSIRLDKQADVIPVDATIMNLQHFQLDNR